VEKILSIDIETTGLDDERHQILEFGAVIGDFYGTTPVRELPCFKRRILWKEVHGDPYALVMNVDLLKDMTKRPVGDNYILLGHLWKQFSDWLNSLMKPVDITITGKNFGSFDRRFLNRVLGWNWDAFSHRFLDPGSLCFEPRKDRKLPDLLTCATRVGVDWSVYKLHEAVEDARLVVAILRAYYSEDE
jgi:DNA polymerase III epsilon subunit-like protein